MDSETVSLSFGSGKIELDIPRGFMAGEVIQPRAMPAMEPQAILRDLRQALANPIGRPRLQQLVVGKRVAVVLSDEFRAGLHELIIHALCEELAAGGPSDVAFLCATGTHQPEVYAPRIQEWVQRYAGQYGLPHRFVGHDCDDPALVHIGESPLGSEVSIEPDFLRADVRVYGHEAKHHYMAGYSLVDKQVIPGICGRRTVEMNHIRSLASTSGPGRNPWHSDPTRRANPFSEDSRDIRAMAEGLFLRQDGQLEERAAESFALDMISDKDSVFWVGAGDPDEICRQAIARADEQAEFLVEPMPYLLVSPGGPPASQAMYGVQNCFDMAVKGAVIPGGEVLVVAPCDGRPDLPPEVSGFATSAASRVLFWDNLVSLRETPLEDCRRWIEENFQLYMWKTYRVLCNFKRDALRIYIHSQLPGDALREAGFHPVDDPQAWILERAARGDGKLRVIDNGNKLLVVARQGAEQGPGADQRR